MLCIGVLDALKPGNMFVACSAAVLLYPRSPVTQVDCSLAVVLIGCCISWLDLVPVQCCIAASAILVCTLKEAACFPSRSCGCLRHGVHETPAASIIKAWGAS